MPVELQTRKPTPAPDQTRSGLALALALHAAIIVAVGIAAWISHRAHPHWGDQNPVAGSIQASMVNALPLPPRQRTLDHAVLTSEKPSIAPTPPPPEPPKPKAAPLPPPKAEAAPKPNEVLLPKKVVPTTPTKPTPSTTETKRPPAQTPPPPPNKATTGETAGVQIPQSITQLKNGTSSITVEERAFGDRYAYYVRLISQKVNQAWQQQEANAAASNGKRTTITFTIERDGTPADPHVSKPSGSATLDSSALRAIQRIDTFGPLPQGASLTIDFTFDFHADH